MGALDQITIATRNYIRSRVEDVFPDEEEDDFVDFVRETRAAAGIVDPPPEKPRFRGGPLIDNIFSKSPLLDYLLDKMENP